MPFRVYAGGGRIQAVGTAFTVRIKGEDVDVTVTEGKVELASVNQRTQANEAEGQDRFLATTYDETAHLALPCDDRSLIAAHVEGDAEAFGQAGLYVQHTPPSTMVLPAKASP